jgi:hypothetical protein
MGYDSVCRPSRYADSCDLYSQVKMQDGREGGRRKEGHMVKPTLNCIRSKYASRKERRALDGNREVDRGVLGYYVDICQ